jgi:L-fucose isomerase-like protein
VLKPNRKETHVGRRDFIKTTSIASVAATLPATKLAGQDAGSGSNPNPGRTKKRLLFLSSNPETNEQFIESIQSISETDLLVTSTKADFQRPQEIIQTIHNANADILVLFLSGFVFNYGSLNDSMGDLNIPVIVFASNPELILIDANLVASLKANGANVTFAISQEQALDFVKNAARPRILEGRRAVLYGRRFDSTSVPAHNLTEYQVYKRTGVKMQYRPIEQLAALYNDVDKASAMGEMERWKSEAVEVVGVSDKAILDACRLYVALRSTIEKEKLSAISIDCLGFTMSPNPTLPYPCLAFARLRDEGITAACEADVCGMLSSMLLQEISRKPSFMCNLMSVNLEKSMIVLSHCVAPLKIEGANAAQMKYRLHDYHGFGRGVVPEVEFPLGMEVATGAFSKDLKKFSLWPGRIQSQVKETEGTSGKGITLNVCANTMDVKIRDAERFLQNIPGIHQIMIAGNYVKAINEALFRMNVGIVGPSDFTPPEV